ncbi:hypothetical protein K2X85_07535 [bacterium]|nr:hypothetical protein [bacterium]
MHDLSPDPKNFGKIAPLLSREGIVSLAAGSPDQPSAEILSRCTWEVLKESKGSLSRSSAEAIRSAILLFHDHLDASHTISQSLESPEGSFLHGIMHRREGDFSNAKYWFRQVGPHPVFDSLSTAGLVESLGWNRFDPIKFVDRVRDVVGTSSPEEHVCQQIQEAEWWFLFQYLWDE